MNSAGLNNEVEFLPSRIRHQRLRRRRLIRQGYLLAACVAVMCILTYVRHGRVAEARGNLRELEKCGNNLRRQVAMIAPLERQMADLLIKKRIDEELGSRTDCTAVLAELCRITPSSVTMVSLDLKTVELHAGASGLWQAHSVSGSGRSPSGLYGRTRSAAARPASRGRKSHKTGREPTVRRIRMVVTGLAPTDVDVANFIGQLSSSSLFENVNMGYTKTIVFRGRSAREFQASCYLVR